MTFTIEGQLLGTLMNTLAEATSELARTRQALEQARESQLLNEDEACAYLKRDAETLRYYRTLGLDSFKKGQYRWYMKSEIDNWLASGKVTRKKKTKP
ncbi:hypothetical protein [Spirosoma spitsbergense]|uniref:hypothetical protein n=1 Tax=Spirosoma spitsbergense TaxID=431554 RepID=UPI0003630B2F|nr:hypothetical protein [Spirosoma spitsbergense]